ncbi:hypothetical Protein YC6258_03874 [Gynuella sunshinyii YC6258]|uniref:Uncharacterized protein n=1 Tax=Gynuella sunshinyii YC6258 TaxID=1445510 RepID=A0A0C5V966_9GAMM|nr:hypothetical Protein YC6258_03874 [Gynuella sunshinyii YC6258]
MPRLILPDTTYPETFPDGETTGKKTTLSAVLILSGFT